MSDPEPTTSGVERADDQGVPDGDTGVDDLDADDVAADAIDLFSVPDAAVVTDTDEEIPGSP